MSPSLFIPFLSDRADGPETSHVSRWNDVVLTSILTDAMPGPNGSSIVQRRSLSTITTPSLSGVCRGLTSFTDKIGRDIVLAGDATNIYRGFSTATGTFSIVPIGATYSLSTCACWEFVSFPSPSSEPAVHDFYATNFSNAPQRMSTRASTTQTFSLLSSDFTNIRARHIAIIGQQLVLGNTADTTSATVQYTPSRLIWSAFGDPRDITPSTATQADTEDLQTGGAVQKIIGGTEYGYVFQETEVKMMRYVGGTTVFDFAPIQFAPGTPIPGSVVGYGGSVYYISSEGFIALEGGAIKRIGADREDSFFWGNVNQSALHEISASIDPKNRMVWWRWNGTTIYLSGYQVDSGRWFRWLMAASEEVSFIGLIREGLPGEKMVAVDPTTRKIGPFNRTAAASPTITFRTAVLQPSPGRRWQINAVRLVYDHLNPGGSSPTLTINAFQILTGDSPDGAQNTTVSISGSAAFMTDNSIPCRVAGMWMQVLLQWSTASVSGSQFHGIEIDYELLGGR